MWLWWEGKRRWGIASRRVSVSWLCNDGVHLEQLSTCGFHWHLLPGKRSLVFYWGWVEKLTEAPQLLREWSHPSKVGDHSLKPVVEKLWHISLPHLCVWSSSIQQSQNFRSHTVWVHLCAAKLCAFFRSNELMGRRMQKLVMGEKCNVEGQTSTLPEQSIPPLPAPKWPMVQ